ncbi:MAG: sigma-54-dependent transcriptional regulator [Calditrichota bacterium]
MSESGGREAILVVDDAPDAIEVLDRHLSMRGFRVFTADSAAAALDILNATPVDLVITDYKMPGTSGLELIRHVRENFKDTEVVMVTGYASIENAVEAVKIGAEEYLPKSFTEEELFAAVDRALRKLYTRRSNRHIAESTPAAPHGLIGTSEAMLQVIRTLKKAASTNSTVLITGECGTGKELVARAIHYCSARASGPFVPINCGGIPEGLLESELFGHVKGAFTGAVESRAGFFQTAEGGSIFLDEISELSLALQVKLLRVLQDKEVCMVGANRPGRVDVKILAATNKDLGTLVQKGTFREDLFFRLNIINISVPPLRERGDDILVLAHHFAAKFAEEFEKPVPHFTEPAMQALKSYDWPGNVRELENIIQRVVVMSDGDTVDIADLPSLMRFSAARGYSLDRSLADVEAEHIRRVVASNHGNKTTAAKILGIDRKTLREKLKQYNIPVE